MNDGVEAKKVLGYMPRKLNTFESQILKSWGDTADVIGIIDGWVRTVTTETDLTETQKDTIIDELAEYVRVRRDEMVSPIGLIGEIRTMMTEHGLST
jgi:hypothetical protein